MKRLLIGVLIITPVIFASCKKYLNADSPSSFTQEYIFSNEIDAAKAVNSIYALFNQDAFTSRVSNIFTGNTDVEVGGVGTAPDNSRRDIWSFECTDANGDLLTVFNNAYNAINRANECIEGIETSALYKSGESKVMKQLLGESIALRTYWYYLLINYWGDLPYKTTPTKAGDNFYLPRTGRDTILTNMINDLIKIEPEMTWADQLDFGVERISREFVIGLIARYALMRGGYWLYPDKVMRRKDDYRKYYEIANQYTRKLKELKPHNLTDYATVFLNECQYVVPKNEDVLYEVAFQPGFGDVAWCMGIRVDAGTHAYGAGSAYLTLPLTYYHSFDTLDKRLPVTCSLIYYDGTLQQAPAGSGGIAPGKWNRMLVKTPLGSASAKGTGINWPIMRYSDVLLMLAESENELNGPTGDAQAALKQVRQRAFASTDWATKVDQYVSDISASKETFFNAIVNERAWEFGGECLRKYDLARWNLFGKKIVETRAALTQMGIDGNAGTGTYANLPDFMYYKKKSDGTIVWYNKFTKPSAPPPVVDMPLKGDNPTGYLRVSWTVTMLNTTTQSPADYIVRNWRGYADNTGTVPVRYILPVYNSIITSSLGTLKNDGYGY